MKTCTRDGQPYAQDATRAAASQAPPSMSSPGVVLGNQALQRFLQPRLLQAKREAPRLSRSPETTNAARQRHLAELARDTFEAHTEWRKRGYRLGGKEVPAHASWDVEIWVHPTGKKIRRDVSGGTFVVALSLDEWEEWLGSRREFADQWMAVQYLRRMQEANAKLVALCKSNPFREADAREAQGRFDGTHTRLKSLLRDVDMAKVTPAFATLFQKALQKALDDNEAARAPCCEKKPGDTAWGCDPDDGSGDDE